MLASAGEPAAAQQETSEEPSKEEAPKRKKDRKRKRPTPKAPKTPPPDPESTPDDQKDQKDEPERPRGGRDGDKDEPERPRGGRDGDKDEPERPRGGRDGSKSEPERPRGGRDGSKSEPERPRSGRDGSKSEPERPRGGRGQDADEPPLPEGLRGSEAPRSARNRDKDKDEPPLPEGLGGSEKPDKKDEPPLPEGLGGSEGNAKEPVVPGLDGSGGTDGEPVVPGLDGSGGGGKEPKGPEKPRDDEESDDSSRLPKISGFGEYRGGARVVDDLFQGRSTLSEGRLHLETEYAISKIAAKAGADFTYDGGEGEFELREANLSFTPLEFLDIKVGRQILSWGTSTSLFINDLFPKDFFAYLLGRNFEQFKSPSDAAKLSVYTDLANLDLVYVPRFNADRFLTGEQLSFFNPLMGKIIGENATITASVPDRRFKDDEYHARLSRNIRGGELAAYGYRGFWKSPAGIDPMTMMQFTFPRLDVYGFSFRDQVGQGIGHLEMGYYNSIDDKAGDDPFINNSELRFLFGYERQAPKLADDLTLGFEYYLEAMTKYDQYRASLPMGFPPRDQYRHVIVLQAVKLLFKQNITAQLYAYLSPSDSDMFIRATVDFRLDDHFTLSGGTNVFAGVDDNTFYGQLETNSSVYMALRYGF